MYSAALIVPLSTVTDTKQCAVMSTHLICLSFQGQYLLQLPGRRHLTGGFGTFNLCVDVKVGSAAKNHIFTNNTAPRDVLNSVEAKLHQQVINNGVQENSVLGKLDKMCQRKQIK